MYGSVHGKNGERLAVVHVYADSGAVSTDCDTTGRYELRDVPPGLRALRFTSDGYEPLALDVTVPRDGAVRVDVALTPSLAALPPVHTVATFTEVTSFERDTLAPLAARGSGTATR